MKLEGSQEPLQKSMRPVDRVERIVLVDKPIRFCNRVDFAAQIKQFDDGFVRIVAIMAKEASLLYMGGHGNLCPFRRWFAEPFGNAEDTHSTTFDRDAYLVLREPAWP